jgi:glucose/arabinose dehydrogenase
MGGPGIRGEGGPAAMRGMPAVAATLGVCVALLLGSCGFVTDPSGPSSGEPPASAPTSGAVPEGSAGTPAAPPAEQGPATVEGVRAEGAVDGFDRPWDLRFLPDGTPLVTERPGQLSVVVDGRREVVARVPDVVAAGEGGLMGLALDPGFATNRRIYLCYAAGADGVVQDVRVVRYRLAEGLDAITGPTPIVTGIPAGAGNRHLGCRVEVGPDRMLWITTGDAVQPSAPQDPRSRAGKVLRATLAGRPAPDNPGGDWDPYVFSLGHRNIQGLSFRARDGAAFTVEHGTNCDDEINRIVSGGNFGWDPVEDGGRYAEGAPMTDPDIPGALPAVWSSGCPTIAPAGAEFITGAQWRQWVGALAVAVLKDQQLLLVDLEGDAVVRTSAQLAGELGRLRTVRNAPDGSLWVTVDATPGPLVRLVPRT